MNAKISVLFICIEAIIYLLLYNMHAAPLKVRCIFLRNTAKNTKSSLVHVNKSEFSCTFVHTFTVVCFALSIPLEASVFLRFFPLLFLFEFFENFARTFEFKRF